MARAASRISKKTGTYHHGDLRRVLLDTAVRVVEKEGVAALSLHALTRRAGVSSAAPYYHFENREQLLAAIAIEGFELLTTEMKRSAAGSIGGLRYLEGLGRGYIRFALAHRGHFRVMFRPELREHLVASQRPEIRESFELLERAVAQAQAEGFAPPGDPRPLVLLAWSSVHGASTLWVDGSLADDGLVKNEDALADTIAHTLGGLLSGSASRESLAAGDAKSAKT